MVGGAFSGACMEAMTHYVMSFEEEGCNRKTLRKVKATPRPAPRAILAPSVLIPTAIGFLAYEYTREAVLKLSKNQEEKLHE